MIKSKLYVEWDRYDLCSKFTHRFPGTREEILAIVDGSSLASLLGQRVGGLSVSSPGSFSPQLILVTAGLSVVWWSQTSPGRVEPPA